MKVTLNELFSKNNTQNIQWAKFQSMKVRKQQLELDIEQQTGSK